MIQIKEENCCGCNACAQCCPRLCINMLEDEKGFVYPRVDESMCIDCGLCEKVCQELNHNNACKPQYVYAAKNDDDEQRLQSSSGGIFIVLAKQIITQGGVVFGACYDDNWEVEHCYVETQEELKPLMCSKYVQSRIGNTYKEAEQFLKQGRKVLFVGTSCQIAGMKRFLRKDYDNLLAVDFICHGVPSPGVWRKYLQEIKADGITSVNFREKQNGGFTWRKFGLLIKGEGDRTISSKHLDDDTYLRGFLGDLYLRPSCYECPAKAGKSGSDITIADYWGVHTTVPEWNDNKGVSLVIVNTNKGKAIFDTLSNEIESKEISVKDIRTANLSYFESPKMPKASIRFWEQYTKMSIKENVDTCLYIPKWRKCYNLACTYADILLKKLTGRL